MNTEEVLLGEGVTLPQARDWVWQHLDNPVLVRDTALVFGVSNSMLGEIAGWPGAPFAASVVQAFFWGHGIDSSALDWGHPVAAGTAVQDWVPPAWAGQATQVSLNTQTGAWSNEAIRQTVLQVAGVDMSGYIATFDPARYPVSSAGTLDGQALGFAHLGVLPASWLTVESLFYGTFLALTEGQGLDTDAVVLAGASFVQLVGMGATPSVFDMAQPGLNLL